jgi:hypothetical protein
MPARRWMPPLAATCPAAFDVFLRGVGGDSYRQVLRRQLGDYGLAAAVGESAYFFTHEMPPSLPGRSARPRPTR